MDVKNLELIHDPKQPSSFHSRRHKHGYNPDLLLASQEVAPNCNKIILDAVPRLQHRLIAVKISAFLPKTRTSSVDLILERRTGKALNLNVTV